MASRFVSAGQIDAGTGDAVSPPRATTTQDPSSSAVSSRKQAEWAAVQAQLDAEKKQREEAQRAANADVGPNGERSLYDVLQANKAAKQAAFEEANKIRNQFRALDDDEIEFLDGVRENSRQEEERRRIEIEEGLKAFREAQAKGAHQAPQDDDEGWNEATQELGGGGDEWAVSSRKRKREKEKVIKGIKRRTSSLGKDGEHGAAEKPPASQSRSNKGEETRSAKENGLPEKPAEKDAATAVPAAPAAKPKAGLVDYGSDDDSE
ncbi:putative nefa-interacting nuclear protein [Phaeoacremonium minimum UCRPA7]|uniref:Putative nefa-interacting nuclear protein n=1 Tax=Phaeoacremonium minimum (strain UCR-PA7) TaxID=1286976 RepID=R8BE01_PHAM7|nr:putative nefa-interacting nuclear protein [Phaeoacremonium minimum UCRPA7]EON97533.1 putative nefa-interacting nuclear protein [Phaeoacremonium minimum UCRPA7]